ncbi:hypothetical protein LJ740_22535 [Planctobacterium marinum]|nr:hypothetical protein [Planctobacterium marinum]
MSDNTHNHCLRRFFFHCNCSSSGFTVCTGWLCQSCDKGSFCLFILQHLG